jgi:hypothetical protein
MTCLFFLIYLLGLPSFCSLLDSGNKMTIKEKAQSVSYGTLYRYATSYDLFLVSLGSLFAIVTGVALPLMTVVFGDIMNSFILYDGSQASKENVSSQTIQGNFVIIHQRRYLPVHCWSCHFYFFIRPISLLDDGRRKSRHFSL